MENVNLQNIDKNLPGGANMGGIPQKIYFAYWKDVASWPTEPDVSSPIELEALATLTGEITMNSGTNFFEMYLTDDTGELTFESVGEKDGKSWVIKLTIFHPGLQKRILGFINAAKNDNLVWGVPDNNGNQFLMGDALRPATYEDAGDGVGTGKETASRPGVGMVFTFKTKNLYHYDGSFPLTPAV